MGGSFKEGGIRTVTAARQEARAELDTHPPTPTSIHTHPHPTRPTPTPAHTHPQTMFFNSSIASSRASVAVFRLPWMSHIHTPIYIRIFIYRYLYLCLVLYLYLYVQMFRSTATAFQLFPALPFLWLRGAKRESKHKAV